LAVAKKSVAKISVGGTKYARRRLSEDNARIYGQRLDARACAEPPPEVLKMS
jgi:hypothetical protein